MTTQGENAAHEWVNCAGFTQLRERVGGLEGRMQDFTRGLESVRGGLNRILVALVTGTLSILGAVLVATITIITQGR